MTAESHPPIPPRVGEASTVSGAPIGQTLGRYRILKKIAQGGMAEVFVARSFGAHGFEKTVAIKRVLPRFALDPQFVRMMVDEAKITVLLNHPHIAQVLELCVEGDDYFIVMEFVPGVSLATIHKRLREKQEHLGVLESCFAVSEMLEGLHAAHTQRDASGKLAHIVHRDVSPQNVLVSFDGHVKLIDFGIARARRRLEMTEAGTIKGKLRYLAPEMIDPARFMITGDYDHRVDVFASGIILWELLARRTLYEGQDEMVVYDAITDADAPHLTALGVCDQALGDIVAKALCRDPDHRFATAEAFADELRAYVYRSNPAFTQKSLVQMLANAFGAERDEMLALERGGPSSLAVGENAPPASARGAPRGRKQTSMLISDPSVQVAAAQQPASSTQARTHAITREEKTREERTRRGAVKPGDVVEGHTLVSKPALAKLDVKTEVDEHSSQKPENGEKTKTSLDPHKHPYIPFSAEDTAGKGLGDEGPTEPAAVGNKKPLLQKAAFAAVVGILSALALVAVVENYGRTHPTSSSAPKDPQKENPNKSIPLSTPSIEPAATSAALPLPSPSSSSSSVVQPSSPPSAQASTTKSIRKPEVQKTKEMKTGRLLIRTLGESAAVFVDGRKWEEKTPVHMEISVGVHRVVLISASQARREEFSIQVKAGEKIVREFDWR